MSATGQGNETIRAKQKAVTQAQQQEGITTLEIRRECEYSVVM